MNALVSESDNMLSGTSLNPIPYPEPGDFSFVRDPLTRMFLHDAYQAVSLANAWVALRTESPPADKGFMFHTSSTTDSIQKFMRYANEHSGASYAITMRAMERIAKKGWKQFVSEMEASQNGH